MSEGSEGVLSAVGGLRVFTEMRVKRRRVNKGNDRDCLLVTLKCVKVFCV